MLLKATDKFTRSKNKRLSIRKWSKKQLINFLKKLRVTF